MKTASRLMLGAIALLGIAGCSSDDDDVNFNASLSAAQEVTPPAGSATATGTTTMTLEDRVLTVVVTVTGTLTSSVQMAHIHGPAAAGTNASIVLDFVPSMTSVINAGATTGTIVTATFDLDALPVSATGVLRVSADALIDMLNTGTAYVNVHTTTNPGGEIRGQIAKQ